MTALLPCLAAGAIHEDVDIALVLNDECSYTAAARFFILQHSSTTRDRIIDIVANQLGVDRDKIPPNHPMLLNDLGADSLDTVELVMELEGEFDLP